MCVYRWKPCEQASHINEGQIRHFSYQTEQCYLSPCSHHCSILHVVEDQLEPVAQIPDVWIRLTLQLKALRYDLDVPIHEFCFLPGLKAQVEIPGLFSIDTKLVHWSLGVSIGIGREPFICKELEVRAQGDGVLTQSVLGFVLKLFIVHHLLDLFGHRLYV